MRVLERLRRTLLQLLLLLLCVAPAASLARTIMVVGPHEDDEALIAAGRMREAVLAGDTVIVVLTTNGDIDGTSTGLLREAESVAAMQVLGIPESQVVFLGYGDQSIYDLFNATSPTQVFTSMAGKTATYGNRGLGGVDYHRYRTGVAGPYNRATILGDFQALLVAFQPDEVYTTSYYDNHGDHEGTARFLTEALLSLKRAGTSLPTRLFESIVWAPYANGGCWTDNWPAAGSGALPYPPFTAPQCVGPGTTLDWNSVLHFPAPPEMQAPTSDTNLKWESLEAYPSQFNDFLSSFVRKDEFFWRYDLADNLSGIATVTVSSDYPAANSPKEQAVDMFADASHEWMSLDDSGAWIQLTWASAVRVGQVNLYDRVDPNDNVLSGTLSFSDGSSIAVGALDPIGKAMQITFAPKTVTWVKFTLDRISGSTPGLSEFEVLGVPATSTSNVPPHFLKGIVASASTLESTQTASLTVQAADLDGDPIGYAWSADGGSVTGTGASAVFTPPAVTQPTIFTITVQISDGRGGTARTSQFITVNPAVPRGLTLSVSPTTAPAGMPVTGTVVLSAAAPSGGIAVSLSSSNPAVASVPPSVTVAAGKTSATFPVTTYTVATATTASISGTLNSNVQTASLTVTPPIPIGLALSPATVVGGNTVVATASLSAGAPPGGTPLSISSTNSVLASAPSGMTIPGGSSSATFLVTTTAVASTQTATLTVSDGVSSATATLSVTPLLVSTVTFNPASVGGGASSTGTVTLNGASGQGGAVVQLSSADPSTVTVPQTVTVAPGASAATFTASTVPVGSTKTVAVTALYGGGNASATLTVNPVALSALAVSPSSVVGGGGTTGTLTLSGPAPAGGLTVPLTSNKPTVASVPASVTVPGGANSVAFPVSTFPVTTTSSVTLSATSNGVTKTAALSVTPLTVSSVKLAPTSVIGGVSATGTVTLTAAAPSGGVSVALSSNNPAVTVPSSVVVAGGSATATFTAASSPVGAQVAVVISAAYANSKTATLTVKPPALSAMSLAQASVVGGTATSARITLTGPAPAGGFQVTLSSANSAAQVPGVVGVAAGASMADVAITTSTVSAVTSGSITATAGTVSKSATLTVTPSLAVMSITLAPSSLTSGGTSVATVTLNGPAPGGGLAVTMKSSRTAVATVPSPLVVAAGASSGTTVVTAATVTASNTSSISAVAGGVTKSATLTVAP